MNGDCHEEQGVPPITGRTRVAAVLGDPVAHSRSPEMHNAAFAALGLDWVYVAVRVKAADLRRAIAGLRAMGFGGANLTVPHKEKALRLVDHVTERARLTGAVNTLVPREAGLLGENTDVVGFRRALRDLGIRMRGRRAVVIGAGGAARAVVLALAEESAAEVRIANRNERRARRLAARFGSAPTRTAAAGLDVLADDEWLRDADLVVNATSLGWGRRDRFPSLCYEATPPKCWFVDLCYGRDTAFLRGARTAGRRGADGSAMLLHQGAEAFRLWTGRRPPLEVMAAAVGLSGASGR